MTHTLNISFVIPAYNEEQSLPRVLKSIHDHIPSKYSYEIIVVDHQSTDNTASIAEQYNATVITGITHTIAGLRNTGVQHATGLVLVFLDADVLLTEEWEINFPNTYSELVKNPKIVTGSWCDIPHPGTLIERYWFKPPLEEKPRALGTGHLIITNELFEQIRGFDESLETGEDYDLCRRASAVCAEIVDNPELRVVHEGYPKTIYQFIRREIWHGKSDYISIQRILESKVAIVSILFIFLHILLFTSLFALHGILSTIIFTTIACICFASSYGKYRNRSITTILVNSILYYFYFGGRSLSLFYVLSQTIHRKNRQKGKTEKQPVR